MESDISEAELHVNLKTMVNNKSPGEGVFPAEFYKVFWIDIKDMLLDSFRYAKENDYYVCWNSILQTIFRDEWRYCTRI